MPDYHRYGCQQEDEYARELTRACRINKGRVINRRMNMLGN